MDIWFKNNNPPLFPHPAFTCSKLTIATRWTYFTPCSSVSIVNFEHVIAGWVLSMTQNSPFQFCLRKLKQLVNFYEHGFFPDAASRKTFPIKDTSVKQLQFSWSQLPKRSSQKFTVSSKFERINSLLFPQKSSENLHLSTAEWP